MDIRLRKLFARCLVSVAACFFASNAIAAYIEAAIGNAVVNDATAVYYNPAGLGFVNNPQIVASWGEAFTHAKFSGTISQVGLAGTQAGNSYSIQEYPFPSIYGALPVTGRVTVGIAGLYTFLGREEYPRAASTRYAQTVSAASLYDVTPAFSYKLRDNLFLGAGADFSFATIELNSIVRGALLGSASDFESRNSGYGRGVGAHAGVLWHPVLGTLLGLVYHSPVSVQLDGHSVLQGAAAATNSIVYNNNFNVKLVAPPSAVFSLVQYVNPRWNFLGTIERMNWNTIRNVVLKNVAFRTAGGAATSIISTKAYYLRNTWRLTLGTQYELTALWAVRGALTYDQDPGNPTRQIVAGDNKILSLGTTYKYNKQCKLDFSYNYTRYRDRNINIVGTSAGSNVTSARTSGGRTSIQGKIILDLV